MGKNSVLVVEDNELNMKLVRNLLQIANYEVLEAMDAKKGIEIARERRPDLILMDIQLPGMDGLSATRIIREDPSMKDMKVVALTAHAMQEDEASALECGCMGYISKPIDTRNFLDTVQKYLEGASTSEKAREVHDTRGRNTVLIVDDQPLNIILLTVKLSSMPGEELRLISATSGKEALKKATSESPDLILLDVIMPEMDGYEVTRRLKADPATRDIPVILVTALDGSADKAMGMEAGAIFALDCDYRDIGVQCAEMALRIIQGAPVTSIKPSHPRKVTYSLNLKTAEVLKIDIPKSVRDGAAQIF